jgi:hypothetical protein
MFHKGEQHLPLGGSPFLGPFWAPERAFGQPDGLAGFMGATGAFFLFFEEGDFVGKGPPFAKPHRSDSIKKIQIQF